MWKNTPLACFLLIASMVELCAQSLQVGLEYKDIHELVGFEKKNSTIINLHFGVFHVKALKGDTHFLVSSRFVDSAIGENDYNLKVVDIIKIPPHREEYFAVYLKGCRLNGIKDDTLFALAVSENTKAATNMIKVWKLNRKTGLIEPFLAKGVTCFSYL